MRTKTKRTLLKSLSCSFACVLAFCGLSLTNVKADATNTKSVTLNMADLITVSESAIKTAGKANVYKDSTLYTGLNVSATEAYTGNFNIDFKGDNAFTFRFPGINSEYDSNTTDNTQKWDDAGQFTFKVTEKGNDSNYFEIMYGKPSNNTQSAVWVKYGTDVRTINTSRGGWLSECKHGNQGVVQPGFYSDRYEERKGGDYNNYFGLYWNGDVLEVRAKVGGNYNANEYMTIAAFDGTSSFAASTSWGLPSMAGMKENGYNISFSSEYAGDATDITFLSLNGVDLDITTKEVTATELGLSYNGETIKDNAVVVMPNEELGKFQAQYAYQLQSGECGRDTYLYTYEDATVEGMVDTSIYGTQNITVNGTPIAVSLAVTTDKLISTTGATVTAATKNDTAGYTGLAVSASGTYTGKFNTSFTGDNNFTFRFPGTSTTASGDNLGQFTFKVAEKGNESNYFEVIYGQASDYKTQSVHVKYGDAIRTININSGNWLDECKFNNQGEIDPAFNSDGYTGTYNNYFGLVWNGNVLEVQARLKNGKGNPLGAADWRPIARFDSATLTNATGSIESDGNICGLPLMTGMKENGYVISFSSDYTDGTDITFLTLNGYKLEENALAVAGTFAGISYQGESFKSDALSANDVITKAEQEDLGTFGIASSYEIGNAKLLVSQAVTVDTTGLTLDKIGEYDVTVSGTPLKIKVISTHSPEQLADLIFDTTATVTPNNKGIQISGATGYTGSFNATFTGDNNFTFRFPGTSTTASGDNLGQFTFKVAEKGNESNYFEVVYADPSDADHCAVYVKQGTNIRTINTYGGAWLNECKFGNQGVVIPGFNSDSYTGTYNNYFGLVWNDNVLEVRARVTKLNGGEEKEYSTIAAFDGTGTFSYGKADTPDAWGLPSMAGMKKNGYVISFSSNYDNSGKGTPITFISLNGLSLNETAYGLSNGGSATIYNDKEVDVDGTATLYYQIGDTVDGFYCTTVEAEIGNATFVKKTSFTVSDIDTSVKAVYGKVVSYNGTSKTYTIVVGGSTNNKVTSANLTLSDDIAINYTVALDEGYTLPIATFTFNGKETVVSKYTEKDGKYVFTFTGVTPQYMNVGVNLSVTAMYEGNREVVCVKNNFSVRDYCDAILTKSATDLGMGDEQYKAFQTLIVDLLNYGAAAQTSKNVGTDDLANKNLSEAQKALATPFVTPADKLKKDGDETTVKISSARLFLDNKLFVGFTISGLMFESNHNVVITLNGETYTYGANAFVDNGDGTYEIQFGEVYAANFDKEITIVVMFGASSVESATYTYSVNSYIARNSTNDLMQKLYSYGKAAENYVKIAE